MPRTSTSLSDSASSSRAAASARSSPTATTVASTAPGGASSPSASAACARTPGPEGSLISSTLPARARSPSGSRAWIRAARAWPRRITRARSTTPPPASRSASRTRSRPEASSTAGADRAKASTPESASRGRPRRHGEPDGAHPAPAERGEDALGERERRFLEVRAEGRGGRLGEDRDVGEGERGVAGADDAGRAAAVAGDHHLDETGRGVPRLVVLRRGAELGGELQHGARPDEPAQGGRAGTDGRDADLLARGGEGGPLLRRRRTEPGRRRAGAEERLLERVSERDRLVRLADEPCRAVLGRVDRDRRVDLPGRRELAERAQHPARPAMPIQHRDPAEVAPSLESVHAAPRGASSRESAGAVRRRV